MQPVTTQRPGTTPQRAFLGQEQFLEAADRIGRQLCRDAQWHDDRCTWLGWAIGLTGRGYEVVYKAASANLYDGTAGIALFLSKLHLAAPNNHLRETVRGATNQILRRLEDPEEPAALGFYVGTVGIGYALLEIAESLDDEALRDSALDLLDRACVGEFPGGELDVIAGPAGTIPALIDIGQRWQRPRLVDTAVEQAKRLMASAEPGDAGTSWPSEMPKHRNLLGFAHGTAGYACALLEAHAVSGDSALRATAEEALRYERSWFNAEQGGWPDFRIDQTVAQGAQPQEPGYPVAWCHGATGIGLSRLRIMELLGEDATLMSELNAALQAASRVLTSPIVPQAADLCLCHGTVGTADFVLAAGDHLGRDDVREVAAQVGRFGIEQYQKPGLPWPCGVQQRGEAPNLMLGIAGIGYFYLRLHGAQALPTPLIVRPGGR